MKKILTLMAAMTAASGAFANDYDWQNIPSSPKTDASHNVEGYNGLQYENSTLSFKVNDGDEIELTVNGKNLKVALDGSNLETELKDGLISFKATKDGTVTLTPGDNTTSVTAIKVVSNNYRDALQIIEDGKASVTKALQQISNYSTEEDEDGRSFSSLFNSAAGLINEESQKIAQLEADLKGYKAKNTVGDNLKDMRSKEQAVAINVANIVTKAQTAHDKYIKAAFTDAQPLTDRINEAESTEDIKNATKDGIKTLNGKTTYIYDFTYDSTKGVGVAGQPKAEWCKTELENIKSDLMAYRDGAMGIYSNLTGIDNAGYGVSADAINLLKAEIDNMIARAIIERDYSNKIEELANNTSSLASVLTTKDTDGKNVFTKPNGYDTWVEDVNTISDFIANTDNRRDYTEAKLKTMVVDVYTQATTTYATLKTELAVQAATSLGKLAEAAQNNIDTYSYKISAKYENEPETQKTYQEEFAKLQSDLNGYKKTITDKEYEKVVLGYNDLASKISEVTNKILGDEGLWTKTLKGQKGEVDKNNRTTAEKLTNKIDAIRANYNDQIENHIKNWKESDFAQFKSETYYSDGAYQRYKDNGDLKTYLEARQSILFDIINNLDEEKVNINNEVINLTNAMSGVDDVEFDPTDNKYRFTDEKVKEYEKAIADINTKIEEQLNLAIEAANERAYYYFMESPTIGQTMTVRGAKNIYDRTKEWLYEGYNNAKMSKEAYEKFLYRYAGIIWKGYYVETVNDIKEDKGEKFLDNAEDKAETFYKAKTMADKIGQLTTEYLSKIQDVVDDVNGEYTVYTQLYEGVRGRKVKYTEAKAKESDYAKSYEKAAGVDEDTAKKFINDKLNSINTVIAEFSDNLEEKALEASSLKAESETAFDVFDEGYIQITDFAAYTANNEAKDEAEKQVALIEAEITNLKTQIADYREDAKAVGETAISTAETTLAAQKTSIQKDFEDYKLGTTYPNSIKGVLEAILADLKAAAEEAKNVQEGGNLDYNGDGVVDANDVKAAKADAQKTGDIKTFNDFLTKYLEFQSKNNQ